MLNRTFANRLHSTVVGCALALLLALAAPVLPGAAAAAKFSDDPEQRVPEFSVFMSVPGSHGYFISIGAEDHRTVDLGVHKRNTFATYSVPGRVTSDGVEANFGKLGRVSVRFTPSDKRALSGPKRGCHAIRGHFDGVIRFRGELGYTQVSAKRARGTVDPGGGKGCKDRTSARPGLLDLAAKKPGPEIGITALGAVAHTEGRTVTLYDVEIQEVTPAGKVIPFLTIPIASSEERRGRISINRAALLVMERAGAIPSPPGQLPVTATVKLPKPFQGTGSYLAVPGAEPTWTGDLSVTLPGAGLVPLAGPGFDALLCTGLSSKETGACIEDLESLLGLPETDSPTRPNFRLPATTAASPSFE